MTKPALATNVADWPEPWRHLQRERANIMYYEGGALMIDAEIRATAEVRAEMDGAQARLFDGEGT